MTIFIFLRYSVLFRLYQKAMPRGQELQDLRLYIQGGEYRYVSERDVKYQGEN